MPRFARQPKLCSTEVRRTAIMKMGGRNGGLALACPDHDPVKI
jgi:hypothetical protein